MEDEWKELIAYKVGLEKFAEELRIFQDRIGSLIYNINDLKNSLIKRMNELKEG